MSSHMIYDIYYMYKTISDVLPDVQIVGNDLIITRKIDWFLSHLTIFVIFKVCIWLDNKL